MHNKQEEKKQFTYFFHSIVLKAISRIFIKVYMHIIDVFNTSGDNVCMMSWRYVETHRDLSILLHWEAHFLFMYFRCYYFLFMYFRCYHFLFMYFRCYHFLFMYFRCYYFLFMYFRCYYFLFMYFRCYYFLFMYFRCYYFLFMYFRCYYFLPSYYGNVILNGCQKDSKVCPFHILQAMS